MRTARCSICRQQVPTLKTLISHYITNHSKLKIVKQLIKSNIQNRPNLMKPKHKNNSQRGVRQLIKVKPNRGETRTLYLNENIHILCSQNEIIIGDGRSNVDMEFSFENPGESKENYYTAVKDGNDNILVKKKAEKRRYKKNCDNSPGECLKVVKRKLKRKEGRFEKHYSINITQLKDQRSLNEASGEFYVCHCREENEKDRRTLQAPDLRIITSRMESGSDTSRSVPVSKSETKVSCPKCGNEYNNETDLTYHMQAHETFCRLCDEYFPNEFVFREHMRLHIFKVFMCYVCGREFPYRDLLQVHFECHMEERTFESVLDMEEDYRSHRYNFTNANYNHSINSILCYLSENQDVYRYGYKFAKVVCEICLGEVYFCNYEQHLQTAHYGYGF